MAGVEGTAPAAIQPKRLALLAVLAHEDARGISRDDLIDLLWPPVPSDSVRHNLTQALYALRRDLGHDQLVLGTSRLRLNPAVVEVDLWRFRSAVASGDDAVAVQVYTGPFLDRFSFDGTASFNPWADAVRRAITRDFVTAATRLARALSVQDPAEALRTWQRVAAVEPLHSGVMADLAQAMSRTGDRAGAINAIHAFGTRLREELGLPLDGELIALADSIRSEIKARPALSSPTAPPPLTPAAPQPADAGANGTQSAPADRGRRPRVGRWPVMAGLGIAAIAAAWSWSRPRPSVVADPLRVAVVPFTTAGDTAHGYLGSGLAQLIADAVDGAGPVRSSMSPPLGAQLADVTTGEDSSALLAGRAVNRLVTGTITVIRDSVAVTLAVWEGATMNIRARYRVTGAVAQALFIADDLSRQLLGGLIGTSRAPVSAGADGTSSLAAFRYYIEGDAAFRMGRYGEAQRAFQAAVSEDSTFARAYFRLSEAADWNGDPTLVRAAAARAAELASRLSWRDRTLLEGASAWRDGDNDLAESRARAIVTRYPDDHDAWFLLGEVLFHANTIRARPFAEARSPFERVVALDPANSAALTHLARLDAHRGDPTSATSYLARAATAMGSDPGPEFRLFRAVLSGDSAGRRAVMALLPTQAGFVLKDAAERLAGYARTLPEAETVADVMISRQTGDLRAFGHLTLAELAQAAGQPARAQAEAGRAAEYDRPYGLELRGFLASLPVPRSDYPEIVSRELAAWAPDRTPGPELVAWAGHRGLHNVIRRYLLGMLALRRGDPAAAAWADSLTAMTESTSGARLAASFGRALRAHVLAAQGRRREALASLAGLPPPGDQDVQALLVASYQSERFLLATLLAEEDRLDEAATVFESLMFGGRHELVLAAPAAIQRARLLVRLGRLDAARADYRLALRTWAAAEPSVRPLADSARRELAALR